MPFFRFSENLNFLSHLGVVKMNLAKSPWKSQIQVTSEKKGPEPHLDPEIQPKRPCVTIFTLKTIPHCHTFFPKLILTIFLFPIFFFA